MSEENRFKQPQLNSPKNFSEPDTNSENCYGHFCIECGHGFFAIGKRNYICKECLERNQERSRMADDYPSLLAENKKLREALEKITKSHPIGNWQVQDLQSIAKAALTP